MNQIIETNIVDVAYCHYKKAVMCNGVFHLNNCRLKWYDIAREDKLIGSFVRGLAREFLVHQAALTAEDELGFILLHRCGESFYFLMFCTWRNANEIWKTVYYYDAEKTEDFSVFPQEEGHKGTFCVWEMDVVAHETRAWTKYLLSGRKPENEDAYLLQFI